MASDEPRAGEDLIDEEDGPSREEGRRRLEGAAELVRRALASGLGALFATEEGIRRVAGDLPKEAVGYLAAQAQHTKSEVVRVVRNEVRRFLDNVDLGDAVAKALSNVTLEVKTEIRFVPAAGKGLRAEIRRQGVAVRRRGASAEGGGEAAGGDDPADE